MKKYITRINELSLFDSFGRSFISAVLGPRCVGKTTLIDHYIESHSNRKWVRFNMDRLSERARVAKEELEIMIEEQALQKIGGKQKIWVFIDEAQKCPELFDQIKLLYDMHKGKEHIKFILTGSAHLYLHELTAESLAGRVELMHLDEFTLREATLLQNEAIDIPEGSAFDILFGSREWHVLEELSLQYRPFIQLSQKTLDELLIWGG